MILNTTPDEALERGPTTTLNEQQLRLAAINEINVGDEFKMTCVARCVELTESDEEQGTEATATLELSRIAVKSDEQPQQAPKTSEQRFYNRSDMA